MNAVFLDELRYEYPQELVPSNETPSSYLAALTWAGAQKRWPKGLRATFMIRFKKNSTS